MSRTNCEERFELKTYVDAFATYEFTELPSSPGFTLIPGPAARLKAILPSLAIVGQPFRLALVAEDLWGNPTTFGDRPLTLAASSPIRNLQPKIRPKTGEWPLVVDGLVLDEPGDLDLAATRQARRSRAPIRRPGDSPSTILGGSARSERRDGRDKSGRDVLSICA